MSKYINLDRVKEVFDYAEQEFCECDYAVKNIREAVENLPAADVRPVVRGKWDTHDVVKVLASGKCLDGFCQCEKCGGVFPIHYAEYIFCPNCGADMREGNHG